MQTYWLLKQLVRVAMTGFYRVKVFRAVLICIKLPQDRVELRNERSGVIRTVNFLEKAEELLRDPEL
jgi:hypothetical protein